jgi:transcriptional regulator with XRE-family HTH domain
VAEEDLERVLAGVGDKLRALRRRRGVTLAELAAETDISVSTLSRLESGKRRPTLELLVPLVRAHHVPLDELIGGPPVGDPRVHAAPIRIGRFTAIPLTRTPGAPQAYKMILPAGEDQDMEQRVHEGYDWLYVLSGRVRLLLGDQDLVLRRGEAAEFDTHVPHAFAAVGPGPAEVLSLFGRQGERVHVRARTGRVS